MTTNFPLRFLPLGGLGEIGLNLMVVKWQDESYLLDCGLMFPDGESPGTDVILPDLEYLHANRGGLKAIIITHGHEDHIGGLPAVFGLCSAPIYAPPFALGLIREKLAEEQLVDPSRLIPIRAGQTIEPGTLAFTFLAVTHSIPDALAVAIRTPVGIIVHTGDFKIDRTAPEGSVFDEPGFARLAEQGVLCLFSDSTNVERPGWSDSENDAARWLADCIRDWSGRVIVSMFATNVFRLRAVHRIAMEQGRQLALLGRSLHTCNRIAREAGQSALPDHALVAVDRLHQVSREHQLLVMTGSQGEARSALSTASQDEHRHIAIGPDDLVLFSSRIIPGNERAFFRVVNDLARHGAQVLHERTARIHASGHAHRDELACMISLLKPRFFVPIHGEYHFLVQHAALARTLGVSETRVIEDGEELGIDEQQMAVLGRIECRPFYRDGGVSADAESLHLRERRAMASQGQVSVLLRIRRHTQSLEVAPCLQSAGIYTNEGRLLREAAAWLASELATRPRRIPECELVETTHQLTRRYFRRALGKRPVVQVFVEERSGA